METKTKAGSSVSIKFLEKNTQNYLHHRFPKGKYDNTIRFLLRNGHIYKMTNVITRDLQSKAKK